MKIGIATFHSAHNYGAQLQAYALKRYLEFKFNAQIEFIRYEPRSLVGVYSLLPHVQDFKSFKAYLVALRFYSRLKKRHDHFKRFSSEALPKSIAYESVASIREGASKYDVLITGSDQVFRYKPDHSEFFYLSFANKLGTRTIAYAPSFGTSKIDPLHTQKITELLNGIDFLSCREKAGAEIIERLTGKKVPVVVDPVFLLDKEDWRDCSGTSPILSDKYVLCYALVGWEAQLAIARKISECCNLRIVMISYPAKFVPKDVELFIPSPQEFVNLFANASYIVTDSFHGTAFSVVFQRPFISYIALPEASSRIVDLLNETGLSNHIINNIAIDYEDLLVRANDYSVFSIAHWIENSKQYLDDSLSGR